jgi:hypothetical protein
MPVFVLYVNAAKQLRAVTDLQRIVRGYFDRKRVAAILRHVSL